jgi:hypothetical protein
VRLGVARIDAEDRVQLANVLVEPRRGPEQVRSNTSEPLLERRAGRRL